MPEAAHSGACDDHASQDIRIRELRDLIAATYGRGVAQKLNPEQLRQALMHAAEKRELRAQDSAGDEVDEDAQTLTLIGSGLEGIFPPEVLRQLGISGKEKTFTAVHERATADVSQTIGKLVEAIRAYGAQQTLAGVTPLRPIRNEGQRVSRNDPCPCDSGMKYKKCCGKKRDASSES